MRIERVMKALKMLNLKDFASISSNTVDLWIGKVSYATNGVLWSSITSVQFTTRAGNLTMSVPLVCWRR